MLKTTAILPLFAGIANSACNWGMWGIIPLVDGECGLSTFPSDPWSGIMAECSSDGDSATIYF